MCKVLATNEKYLQQIQNTCNKYKILRANEIEIANKCARYSTCSKFKILAANITDSAAYAWLDYTE